MHAAGGVGKTGQEEADRPGGREGATGLVASSVTVRPSVSWKGKGLQSQRRKSEPGLLIDGKAVLTSQGPTES